MGGEPSIKMDSKEDARRNKILIRRASRKIQREIRKLELREKRWINEIKSLIKKGKHGAGRLMTQNIVLCRKQIDEYYTISAQMKSMEMRIGTMAAQSEITKAIKATNIALSSLNQGQGIDMQNIMLAVKEYHKITGKLESKQEIINEGMEMGCKAIEEEVEELYNQILEEAREHIIRDSGSVPHTKINLIKRKRELDRFMKGAETRLEMLKNT